MSNEKLLKDLALGNMGRKVWMEQPTGHPAGEVLMMLSGAASDLDKALGVAAELRRRVLDQRKELRRLNRKLKDRQLGASIYKAALSTGTKLEEGLNTPVVDMAELKSKAG